MVKTRKNESRSSRGQVLAEYAVMLAMVLAVTLTLLFLMAVFSEYSWRMTALLGWEP